MENNFQNMESWGLGIFQGIFLFMEREVHIKISEWPYKVLFLSWFLLASYLGFFGAMNGTNTDFNESNYY